VQHFSHLATRVLVHLGQRQNDVFYELNTQLVRIYWLWNTK